MEWNNNGNQLLRAPPPAPPPNFVVTNTSRPLENSFSFLYNYNYDHFHLQASSSAAAAAEMKQMVGHVANGLVPVMEKNNPISSYGNNIMDKKKRLTTEQLDSLEASFQEETKLEPDRKMKLAQELGLQPRQVAVWFQNRRARWKAKQLERLYDTLKHEYDVVSNEKQKLQEEVLALRAILKEQVTKNQVLSGGYTEISGEETVESTSVAAIRCSSHKLNPAPPSAQGMNEQCQTMGDQANYVFTVDDYNPVVPPAYWGVLPSYPLN